MLKNLNRHVFAEVQSYLFPFYFFLQGVTSCIQFFVFLYYKRNLLLYTQQDMYMVSDSSFICVISVNIVLCVFHQNQCYQKVSPK